MILFPYELLYYALVTWQKARDFTPSTDTIHLTLKMNSSSAGCQHSPAKILFMAIGQGANVCIKYNSEVDRNGFSVAAAFRA